MNVIYGLVYDGSSGATAQWDSTGIAKAFFSSAEKTKQRTTLTSTMGWKKKTGLGPDTGMYRLALFLSVSLSYSQRNKHQVHPHLFRQHPKTFTLTRRPTDMSSVESVRKTNVTGQKNCPLMDLNQKWMIYLLRLTHNKVITPDNPTIFTLTNSQSSNHLGLNHHNRRFSWQCDTNFKYLGLIIFFIFCKFLVQGPPFLCSDINLSPFRPSIHPSNFSHHGPCTQGCVTGLTHTFTHKQAHSHSHLPQYEMSYDDYCVVTKFTSMSQQYQ